MFPVPPIKRRPTFINQPEAQRVLGSQLWDVVVDFISFTPADLEARLALFRGRTRQFIFISSAKRVSEAGHGLPGDGVPRPWPIHLGILRAIRWPAKNC